MALLKQGDRIRLKTRTIGGWKDCGTVKTNQLSEDDVVVFAKDDYPYNDTCLALRHEVAKMRG